MDGVHLALGRDPAKQLFAAQGADEIGTLLEQWLADPQVPRLDSGGQWRVLQQSLAEGSQLNEATGPLQQCFLGGRDLAPDSNRHLILHRPDFVPHLAQALAAADHNWLQQRLGDQHTQQLADYWSALAEFFSAAATNRECTVFSAPKTSGEN